VLRLFDKPGISSHGIAANVGVQWGIFFALAAAGLLTYAGSRMRGARRPEPPLQRVRPRYPEAPPPPAMPRPALPPAPRQARRPVAASPATEQLSFEDHPSDSD
jgi:hypothetical protein